VRAGNPAAPRPCFDRCAQGTLRRPLLLVCPSCPFLFSCGCIPGCCLFMQRPKGAHFSVVLAAEWLHGVTCRAAGWHDCHVGSGGGQHGDGGRRGRLALHPGHAGGEAGGPHGGPQAGEQHRRVSAGRGGQRGRGQAGLGLLARNRGTGGGGPALLAAGGIGAVGAAPPMLVDVPPASKLSAETKRYRVPDTPAFPCVQSAAGCIEWGRDWALRNS
jgi:hypothetical protein